MIRPYMHQKKDFECNSGSDCNTEPYHLFSPTIYWGVSRIPTPNSNSVCTEHYWLVSIIVPCHLTDTSNGILPINCLTKPRKTRQLVCDMRTKFPGYRNIHSQWLFWRLNPRMHHLMCILRFTDDTRQPNSSSTMTTGVLKHQMILYVVRPHCPCFWAASTSLLLCIIDISSIIECHTNGTDESDWRMPV